MLKSLGFVLLCSALGACATTGEVLTAVVSNPVEVKVKVPVPCLAEAPKAPGFSDDKDLLTGSGAQVFDKVWADHLARRGYERDLAAALTVCAGATKGTPKAAR